MKAVHPFFRSVWLSVLSIPPAGASFLFNLLVRWLSTSEGGSKHSTIHAVCSSCWDMLTICSAAADSGGKWPVVAQHRASTFSNYEALGSQQERIVKGNKMFYKELFPLDPYTFKIQQHLFWPHNQLALLMQTLLFALCAFFYSNQSLKGEVVQ